MWMWRTQQSDARIFCLVLVHNRPISRPDRTPLDQRSKFQIRQSGLLHGPLMFPILFICKVLEFVFFSRTGLAPPVASCWSRNENKGCYGSFFFCHHLVINKRDLIIISPFELRGEGAGSMLASSDHLKKTNISAHSSSFRKGLCAYKTQRSCSADIYNAS